MPKNNHKHLLDIALLWAAELSQKDLAILQYRLTYGSSPLINGRFNELVGSLSAKIPPSVISMPPRTLELLCTSLAWSVVRGENPQSRGYQKCLASIYYPGAGAACSEPSLLTRGVLWAHYLPESDAKLIVDAGTTDLAVTTNEEYDLYEANIQRLQLEMLKELPAPKYFLSPIDRVKLFSSITYAALVAAEPEVFDIIRSLERQYFEV